MPSSSSCIYGTFIGYSSTLLQATTFQSQRKLKWNDILSITNNTSPTLLQHFIQLVAHIVRSHTLQTPRFDRRRELREAWWYVVGQYWKLCKALLLSALLKWYNCYPLQKIYSHISPIIYTIIHFTNSRWFCHFVTACPIKHLHLNKCIRSGHKILPSNGIHSSFQQEE